jgi:hypothetical protein
MTIPQVAEIWYWQGEMSYREHHLIVSHLRSDKVYGQDVIQHDFETICLETGEPDVIYFRSTGRWERA